MSSKENLAKGLSIAPHKAKAESAPGVADIISEIEASATRPQRKAAQDPAAEPSRSLPGRDPSHTDRILASGASHEQRIATQKRLEREARTGVYSDGGPDGIRLRLSAQTLGDFLAPAKQIGFAVARLSFLNASQMLKARAAHRRFRESGGDREHLLAFLRDLEGK